MRESYFAALRTDDAPLSRATAPFGLSEAAAHVLDDFARYPASLHEKGVLPSAYNRTNVLYRTEPDGSTHLQSIDTNRMTFVRRTSRRACPVDLRRPGCPAAAYPFIVSRSAAARGWDIGGNLLRSAVSRLPFERRQRLESEIRKHRHGGSAKKRTA